MQTIAAYIGAAIAEIAGCFAFWAWLRLDKSIWWILPGFASLGLFAYLLTLVDSAAGGQMVADSRKNLLIITERPTQIQKIRNLIDAIDQAVGDFVNVEVFVDLADSVVEDIPTRYGMKKKREALIHDLSCTIPLRFAIWNAHDQSIL